jgi:predicted ferric reductase
MVIGTAPWTVKWSSYSATWSYIMWVTGLIGMVIMTWQTVLWIRAIWWKWIEDFFWVNWLHKWLWIWSFASIIIHPIASVIAYWTTWVFMFSLDFDSTIDTYISLWKIAFDLIIAVFVTSVVIRKMLRYKVWHTIHLITYVAIGLVWFHWYFSWSMIASKPYIQYYWLIIWWILAAVLTYRIMFHWWVGKVTWTVTKIKHLTSLVTEYQIKLNKEIVSQPGQFVYIQLKQWWDSHPFSIVEQEW